MIDKKDLELKLLLRESHIQQLNLKVEDYKNAYDSVIIANKMLKKEIERLKESEEYHRKGYAELYKRIDEVMEYIKENYTNRDGSIWHEAMQDIYKIIEGDYNEN